MQPSPEVVVRLFFVDVSGDMARVMRFFTAVACMTCIIGQLVGAVDRTVVQ